MPTYTLTTTPDQDGLLSWVVSADNHSRDTSLTNDEFINVRFFQLLAPFEPAYKAWQMRELQKAFLAAEPKDQTQVKLLLGLP